VGLRTSFQGDPDPVVLTQIIFRKFTAAQKMPSMATPPCILHEDDALLVARKPAGWNTHAPAPHAGEGLYEWLRDREPRWATLALVHRLDKDTSGVIVFAKTPAVATALTAQFGAREVQKRYLLLTDATPPHGPLRIESTLVRQGERYESRPARPGDATAITCFERLAGGAGPALFAAEPLTGRTHQIRVHAAALGIPIRGDRLYGGSAAPRLCLHAARIALRHPASGEIVVFEDPADFAADTADALRRAIIDPAETEAWRMRHGAADGCPGWYVDQFGPWLLAQSAGEPDDTLREQLSRWAPRGAYFKQLTRELRRLAPAEASPAHLAGAPAPERFVVRENGVRYALSFAEGYSVGLFLDQRDNRRRLLTGHIAAGFPLYAGRHAQPGARHEVLNTFAYTCAFSVCAALGGARVTSLDLSRKYLDWGRHHFELNGVDPREHDFIYGDAFEWLRRLQRKGRRFDAVLLDPPTFSRNREGGTFRAEHDYGRLVTAALALLAPGGVLLASTNAARLPAAQFLDHVRRAIEEAGRRIGTEHYVPQPPDFPVSRAEPAYLKTVWLRVE
jgi:23S rRNA (cytosine1962-C5)-methyltransferase